MNTSIVINELIKDCNFRSTKDFAMHVLNSCEAEFGHLCFHMDYELFPSKIECSLTLLMHSRIDNGWHEVSIDPTLKDELEKLFKSHIKAYHSRFITIEEKEKEKSNGYGNKKQKPEHTATENSNGLLAY